MQITAVFAAAPFLALCACGAAEAPPPRTADLPARAQPAAARPTISASATCKRVPPDGFRIPGNLVTGDGVSAYAVFAAERTQPPQLVVPAGDELLVCTPAVTPRCTSPEPDSAGGYREESNSVELGVLRAVDGSAAPVLRYRTKTDVFGPSIETQYGSRREATCSEGTEWIWAARPEGAVLLGAPSVEWRGGGDKKCLVRVTTRIDRGLLCFDADPPSGSLPVCEGIDLPSGCFAVSGDHLVQTDADQAAEPPTIAHPWSQPKELPLASPKITRTAIAEVEGAVVACLAKGQKLGVGLTFPGDGTATIRKLQSQPPLSAKAEACVREALSRISHPPFRGTVNTNVSFPPE